MNKTFDANDVSRLPVVCCDRETDQSVSDGYSKLASMIRSLMAESSLVNADISGYDVDVVETPVSFAVNTVTFSRPTTV